MRRILGACAFVVALGILLALLRPSPTLSDAGLTNLVNSAYPPRTEDSTLHEIAHQRAVEVSINWSHEGIRPGTAEVLAYNAGFADPASTALHQWQSSPAHHAILSDTRLDLIGCGSHQTADGTSYFACVLMAGEPPVPSILPSPTGQLAPTAQPTVQSPQPVLLPNTAIQHGGGTD